MSQEPWNEEIYEETAQNSRRGRSEKRQASSTLFTILGILFLILVIGITAFAIYLSTGGSKTNSTQEFYNTSTSSTSSAASEVTETSTSTVVEETTESTVMEEKTTTSSSAAVDGESITVNAGEGEASIAARAGISIADLERLNPDKMSTGSWLAHPGDTVRIK